MNPRVVINLGSGPKGSGHALPDYFEGWRELRVDVDPGVKPDVVASMTDLFPFGRDSIDAIWSAHCIEHLYEHEVKLALAEFHRILKDDGFACMIVPDLQTISSYITSDRMHEVIYESNAGPITAHDIIFGHGATLALGRTSMAHKCGFTPTVMMQRLKESPFEESVLMRRPNLELAAIALKKKSADDTARQTLIDALKL